MNKDELSKMMEKEVDEMVKSSDFEPQEVREAFERSVRYFKDTGSDDTQAWDQAQELVYMARYRAEEMGGLRGAVDQMLFSVNHRTQSGVGM